MFKRLLKAFVKRNTIIRGYVGNREEHTIIVEVHVFGFYVGQVRIHPPMKLSGYNSCGMPTCEGIHRTL